MPAPPSTASRVLPCDWPRPEQVRPSHDERDNRGGKHRKARHESGRQHRGDHRRSDAHSDRLAAPQTRPQQREEGGRGRGIQSVRSRVAEDVAQQGSREGGEIPAQIDADAGDPVESGTANPSVETLWAIATALGVPFAVFVEKTDDPPTLIRARDGGAVRAIGAPYEALLLAAGAPQARSDLYLLRAEPGSPRSSLPHAAGTVEHVVLVAGAALVGPADAPVELGPGDYLRYRGDAPHVFEALEPDTSAVLISEVR